MSLINSFLGRPVFPTGTMATGVYQGIMNDGRKNTVLPNRRSVGLSPCILNVNNPKPSLIPLTGILPRASMTACGSVPPTFPQAPSQAPQDSRAWNSKVYPIVISGRYRIALRCSAISLKTEVPFSILVALRCVAHESNPIGEFMSWVTNVLSRATK